MEFVGHYVESLNCVLRVTENCWTKGVSRGGFFYLFGVCVCVCFCLFYFVIRITVDYVQNKLLLEEREEGWTQVEAEGPLGDKK